MSDQPGQASGSATGATQDVATAGTTEAFEIGHTDGGQYRQLKYLSLSLLDFDPDNPRFPMTVRGDRREEQLRWLLNDASLTELMASIASQGFFPGEPLLVAPHPTKPGRYIVVEGNRRFAACLLLNDPKIAPTRKVTVQSIVEEAQTSAPTDLPTLVFASRDETLGFLGYRHITGIAEWGPLAKARYLRQLWDRQSVELGRQTRLRLLAQAIGSTVASVGRLLTAHFLYEHIASKKFYDIEGLDEESIQFSLLTVALSRRALPPFLGLANGRDFEGQGLDEERLEEMARWLYAEDAKGITALGESRNMGEIAAIVDDSRALAEFREGLPRRQAYLLTVTPDDAVAGSLLSAKDSLANALRALHKGHEARSEDLSLLEQVRSVLAEIESAMDDSSRGS